MKKIVAFSVLTILSIMMLVSCSTAYSSTYYDEISSYVKTNAPYIETSGEVEYFLYSEVPGTEVNTYYGYYYAKNGARQPYSKENMSIDTSKVEAKDGGFYYGEVDEKSDWCFIKAITKGWYYFETHDYIYN